MTYAIHLQYAPSLRYQFVEDHRGQYPVSIMCRLLKVSPSGYCAWRGRPESRRSREHRLLLVEIRTVFAERDQAYGCPRMYRDLRARGLRCSVTTDAAHDHPVAENLFDRQFAARVPNARWAADMTYLWTSEGWLYLAVVMDLCSRRIVGWSMQASLAHQLVIDAMGMALGQAGAAPGPFPWRQ